MNSVYVKVANQGSILMKSRSNISPGNMIGDEEILVINTGDLLFCQLMMFLNLLN